MPQERTKQTDQKQPTLRHSERRLVEGIRNRLTSTLGEVVAYKTIGDGMHDAEIQGLFDYVEARVAKVEAETGKKFLRKTWNNNGVLSTIITPEDPTRTEEETLLHPKVGILTHIDEVDGEEEMFTLKKEGDKLKARGGLDMKGGGLVPILVMLDELPIGAELILTSDEEKGGINGAKFLAEKVGLQPEFLIIADGQKPEHISYGSKGVWHTKISFRSPYEGGHGSRYEDRSAIETCAEFMYMMRNYYRWELNNSPKGPTINFGKIIGGDATNTIAKTAEMWVDMRFPDEQERERGKRNYSDAMRHVLMNIFSTVYPDMIYASVFKKSITYPPIKLLESWTKTEDGRDIQIMQVMDGIIGIPYEVARVETLGDTPVYAIDPNDYRVKRFVEILQSVTGKGVSVNEKDTGGNDGRHFLKVPAAVFLPMGAGAHMSNEWVSEESLVQTHETIRQFLHEICGN